MCANVGVDPLASNKGMWAQLLHFGDFYYELGVQIVEACLATRAMNGGLMDLDLLRSHVTVWPFLTMLISQHHTGGKGRCYAACEVELASIWLNAMGWHFMMDCPSSLPQETTHMLLDPFL